jgi:predicted ester cyclase
MTLDRRLLLSIAVALPVSRAAGQNFPPPVPDVPSSEIEKSKIAATNADIIRRQNEIQNGGDFHAAAQFFAEDTRNHGVAVGRKGVLRVLTDIFTTFPDFRSEIFDLMAVDDMVVIRTMNTGTHKGVSKIPFNGGLLVGVPPTNKKYRVQTIHWHTLKDGLIVEHRANRDDIGMMQQLGLLPMTARYDLPKVS